MLLKDCWESYYVIDSGGALKPEVLGGRSPVWKT